LPPFFSLLVAVIRYNKGWTNKLLKGSRMTDNENKELFAAAAREAEELHGVSLAEIMSNPDKYERFDEPSSNAMLCAAASEPVEDEPRDYHPDEPNGHISPRLMKKLEDAQLLVGQKVAPSGSCTEAKTVKEVYLADAADLGFSPGLYGQEVVVLDFVDNTYCAVDDLAAGRNAGFKVKVGR
jgi:hypothetical protein